MSTNSFYSRNELAQLGLRAYGDHVFISRYARLYSPEKISLGHDVRIDDFCILSAGGDVSIGTYVHIAAYCAIYGGGGVVMDDFSGLSARTTVYSQSDDFSGESMTNPMVPREYRVRLVYKPVHIGKHALVGANSTLMPGVEIGEGVAIGAHSLVMKDCEPWGIYFGSPARRVRERSRTLLQLADEFLAKHS
jgi:dTDP-4-amino-4,6-dideoxy-D-glucose acyltransferase